MAKIKKDIVFTLPSTEEIKECTKPEQSSTNSIDEIFENADNQMEVRYAQLKKTKKKHKRRHGIFLRIVLPLILILISIVGILTYVSIQQLQESVPVIRESLIQSVLSARKQLESTDDAQLSVDEYYQKRLLLVLSEEEITSILSNVDIDDAQNMIQEGRLSEELIPKEKLEEYKALLKEYEKAKVNEALIGAESMIGNTTIPSESQ